MPLYTAFGLTLSSEIELPELPQAVSAEGDPDVTIRIGTVPNHGVPKGDSYEQFVNASIAGRFHVKFGNEIVVDPAPDASPSAIRLLLLGRVMACLLRLRGWLPLHASAVAISGEAVLFLGASGEGKSTMAAACHARGHSIVTDDIAATKLFGEECRVLVAGARVRLADDSIGVLNGVAIRRDFQVDKYSVNLERGRLPDSLPVRRFYFLHFGDEVGRDAMPALVAASNLSIHSFIRHRWLEPEALKAHIRDCAAIAQHAPVFTLTRPKTLDCLGAVVRFIEEDLNGGESGFAGSGLQGKQQPQK